MPLIEVIDLIKIYTDGTKALRGVSFSIEQGEFVAIIGPSGSGKSTLLHMLGFLDKHSDGTYRFKGKTIDALSSDELARVRNQDMGFVFQAFNLLAHVSVTENVIMPLYYSDVPESRWHERATAVIELVGLTHRKDQDCNLLSGGEKQRVAIARALINNPSVIFADEPTGNLDSVAGKAIVEFLHDLHEKGHTVVLITHDRDIANMAHRILEVRDGLLVNDSPNI